MKFGQAITERVRAGWEYVPYKKLKKKIKLLAAAKQEGSLVEAQTTTTEFFNDLQSSIVATHTFFILQVDAEWGEAMAGMSQQVFVAWTDLSQKQGVAVAVAVEAVKRSDHALDHADVLSALAVKLSHIESIEQYSKLNRTVRHSIHTGVYTCGDMVCVGNSGLFVAIIKHRVHARSSGERHDHVARF